MTFPTIAATAVAAPLVVALICLFAWRRFEGGRHLLFWAVGHAAVAVSFAVLGFGEWWDAQRIDLHVAGVAANQIWAVTLAAGALALAGRPVRPWPTAVAALGATLIVLLLQRVSETWHYAGSPVVSSLLTLFAGIVLLRAKGSIFYTFMGLLLLGRAALTLSLAADLVQQTPAMLNSALSVTAFMNLLTGLALIMIEFDNARQREYRVRKAEQENRLFFETLLESMPATVSYKDTELRYRIMNRRMRELRQAYDANYMGRTWGEIAGEDAASAIENVDRQILATGEPAHMEQAWTGRDGRPIVIWALKVPLRDTDGRIIGIITCGLDITRLKETEAQLIDQREAAETASRVKNSFLANMSHELRTPLNAIIGFADMLAAGYGGPLSERQQGYAVNIRDSGEHLLRLVNDILDLSRLESGRLEMQIADCDFEQIAASALAMVLPQARQAGVTLSYTAQPLTVQADERALTQILINLLGNAVKFNRPQGSVSLEASSANGVTHIRVQDTGIGMSEAESRAVVQPLYRADVYRSRPQSGAGLGLSICRSLVELHGGRLDIRSEPGVGTLVEIALPG